MSETRLPRENLVRAVYPAVEVRAAEDGGMPTMHGHFAVFNEWARISSVFEGTFLERLAPGVFAKTFAESRDKMRVTFQHGKDPQLGDKPLGPIDVLREDERGAYYEVPLLDTSYNRDLLPGLRAGLYGSSFRFSVVKEEMVSRPKRSDHNPDGLPERTIREAQVPEFGPVTYPAYAGATAGIRSLTDEYLVETLTADPDRMRAILEHIGALPRSEPAVGHSAAVSRPAPPPISLEDFITWIS